MTKPHDNHHAHMNDTKWREIRNAMCRLAEYRPRWRTLDVENGHLSDWDGDWYYHFELGGYKTIERLEIKIDSEEMRERVRQILVSIHVPGRETEEGFMVLGYTRGGDDAVDYIKNVQRF